MQQSTYKRLLIVLFVFITLTGIFLPGFALYRIFDASLNVVESAPQKYYPVAANSVISKNASARLTEYEKIKLISGAWDSTGKQADANLSEITKPQAAELARAAVDELYRYKVYPYHFDSSYGNWYTWDAVLYQYTETSFHTYTAYCWLVTFSKYNTDEVHEVLITEKGTLLSVRNNRPVSGESDTFLDARLYYQKKYENTSIAVSFLKVTDYNRLPAYPNTALENPEYLGAYALVIGNGRILTWKDFDKLAASPGENRNERYCFYRYQNAGHSTFTFIPWK